MAHRLEYRWRTHGFGPALPVFLLLTLISPFVPGARAQTAPDRPSEAARARQGWLTSWYLAPGISTEGRVENQRIVPGASLSAGVLVRRFLSADRHYAAIGLDSDIGVTRRKVSHHIRWLVLYDGPDWVRPAYDEVYRETVFSLIGYVGKQGDGMELAFGFGPNVTLWHFRHDPHHPADSPAAATTGYHAVEATRKPGDTATLRLCVSGVMLSATSQSTRGVRVYKYDDRESRRRFTQRSFWLNVGVIR